MQSHYGVCIAYANLRKCMQILAKLLISTTFEVKSELSTTVHYKPMKSVLTAFV